MFVSAHTKCMFTAADVWSDGSESVPAVRSPVMQGRAYGIQQRLLGERFGKKLERPLPEGTFTQFFVHVAGDKNHRSPTLHLPQFHLKVQTADARHLDV